MTGSIETARLRLRPVRAEDAALLPDLVGPSVGAMTASWSYPFTSEMADARVAQTLVLNRDGTQFNRLIESRDGLPMGWLGVAQRIDAQRSGMLGYWLNDRFHGQGYLTEALQAFVPAAMASMRLERLEAGARPDNAASIAALSRLGMHFTGQRLHFVPARDCEELTNFYAMDRAPNAS